MISFANLIFAVLAARAFVKLTFATHLLSRSGRAPHRCDCLNTATSLVIIVKAYDEQHNIPVTISYLRSLIRNYPNVEAIIAGTSLERDPQGNNPTLQACRAALKNDDKISITEAKGEYANGAAGQVNFAIQTITSGHTKTWVLLMDVDTRIPEQGFEELMHWINQGYDIIQLSDLFLDNYRDISFLQKGHAILQSRWTISHEKLRLSLYGKSGLVLVHVVGHGLCVRISKLMEYGGVPTGTGIEDIELGFYLAVMGEKIKSCASFDNSDCPQSVKEGVRQEWAWSFGAMNYLR